GIMRMGKNKKSRLFALVSGLALIMAVTPLVFGQATSTKAGESKPINIRSVPRGAKLKIRGGVMGGDADTFTVPDPTCADYQVLLTDATSIKTYGGIFSRGKKYASMDILRGPIVEVEGRGDAQGQLVADKVRFNESDMRAAITTDTRVNPVEENQERLSG